MNVNMHFNADPEVCGWHINQYRAGLFLQLVKIV